MRQFLAQDYWCLCKKNSDVVPREKAMLGSSQRLQWYFSFCFLFWDRVSCSPSWPCTQCNWEWPWTLSRPTSTSQVLGPQRPPPHLVYTALCIEPKLRFIACTKSSLPTELHSQTRSDVSASQRNILDGTQTCRSEVMGTDAPSQPSARTPAADIVTLVLIQTSSAVWKQMSLIGAT